MDKMRYLNNKVLILLWVINTIMCFISMYLDYTLLDLILLFVSILFLSINIYIYKQTKNN